MPRPDHFEAPGPELRPSQHPELFQLLDSIREATGQAAPTSVYLTAEVNAWVAQRGGLMGIGSRRVMGLGLPLMQALTVHQLRAVLVHEFVHYDAGDTMLGPWIQKTRMGILRTVVSLGDSWIRFPFTIYSKLFFRTTNAVSRQQEFAADALAARLWDRKRWPRVLKQVHRAAAAFAAFWQNEYVPALRYQVRPPLAAGFSRFMVHKQVAANVESALVHELGAAKVDPTTVIHHCPNFVPHLAQFKQTECDGDTRASIALLNGVPELEGDLLGIAVHTDLRSARPVNWSDVPQLVWYPNWRNEAGRQTAALADATVADAATLVRDPQAVARKLLFHPGFLPDMDQRRAEAQRVIGAALGVALVDAGWRLEGDLGNPITCVSHAEVLEPFGVVEKFVSGE